MRENDPVSPSPPDVTTASRRAAPRLVFVDEQGRRARWLSRAAALLAGVMALYLAAVGGSVTGATWVPQLSLPVVGVVVPGARFHVKLDPPATTSPSPPPVSPGGPTSAPTTLTAPGAGTPATQNAIDQVQVPAPVPVQAAHATAASASAPPAPLPASSSNPSRTSSGTVAAPVPKTTPSGKTPPGQVAKTTQPAQSHPGVTAPGRIKH